jgi:hypothetical protein
MKTLLLTLLVFSACAATGQELELTMDNLSGKWEFSDIIAENLSEAEIEERKSLMEGLSLTLNPNGTCLTSFVMDLEGAWTFDPGKRVVVTIDPKGTNDWFVHKLTPGEVLLSRNQMEFKLLFVKK